VLIFSLFESGFATPVCAAPVTYSYSGQPFTLFGGSGESYSSTGGNVTIALTQLNSLPFFSFGMGSTGIIQAWDVAMGSDSVCGEDDGYIPGVADYIDSCNCQAL
jgi:hypothetical protein